MTRVGRHSLLASSSVTAHSGPRHCGWEAHECPGLSFLLCKPGRQPHPAVSAAPRPLRGQHHTLGLPDRPPPPLAKDARPTSPERLQAALKCGRADALKAILTQRDRSPPCLATGGGFGAETHFLQLLRRFCGIFHWLLAAPVVANQVHMFQPAQPPCFPGLSSRAAPWDHFLNKLPACTPLSPALGWGKPKLRQ